LQIKRREVPARLVDQVNAFDTLLVQSQLLEADQSASLLGTLAK
jgi:hypothetical protein